MTTLEAVSLERILEPTTVHGPRRQIEDLGPQEIIRVMVPSLVWVPTSAAFGEGDCG